MSTRGVMGTKCLLRRVSPMRIGDDAGIRGMRGYQVNGLALDQVKRPRISDVGLNFRRHIISIERRISKIQPVARNHDSIGIDVHPTARLPKSLHSTAVVPEPAIWSSTTSPGAV